MDMCNKSYEFAKTSNWRVRLGLLINSPVKNNEHMPFWGGIWLGCDPESGVLADVEYLQNPSTHCVKSISPSMRRCRVKICKAITAGMWAACGGFQGRGKQKALFTVQWFVHNEWQITVFARPQMAADSKWAAGVKSKWHLLQSVEREKKKGGRWEGVGRAETEHEEERWGSGTPPALSALQMWASELAWMRRVGARRPAIPPASKTLRQQPRCQQGEIISLLPPEYFGYVTADLGVWGLNVML